MVAADPNARVLAVEAEHRLDEGQGISALAFGPDGPLLAVGDETGRVALWDGALHHRRNLLVNEIEPRR